MCVLCVDFVLVNFVCACGFACWFGACLLVVPACALFYGFVPIGFVCGCFGVLFQCLLVVCLRAFLFLALYLLILFVCVLCCSFCVCLCVVCAWFVSVGLFVL